MLEELEELIQLGQDYDPGAAVCCTTFFGIVWRNRNIFTATGCRNVRGIQSILALEDTDDGSCAFAAEIPVIF